MTKKKLAITVATVAVMMGSMAVPAMAQEQQYGAPQQGQVAQQQAPQGQEVSVTGVIERLPSDGGPSPYGITDETSGASYVLDRGEGDYSTYDGQRVTVTGTAQVDPNTGFNYLAVSEVVPAAGAGAAGQEPKKVTWTFEAKTDCGPPAGTALFGRTIAPQGTIGGISDVPLSDEDGDGVYAGSDFAYIVAGSTDPNVDTAPPTLQVVRGATTQASDGTVLLDRSQPVSVVEDFGTVKLDEDKTFSASASFCDGGATTGMGETTGLAGGTTGPAQAQYEDGGSAEAAGIDLNEDGAVDGADGRFAAQTSDKGVSATPEKGALPGTGGGLPSTGGLVLPVAGLAGALLLLGGLLLRKR